MRQLKHPHKLEVVEPKSCPAKPGVIVVASIAESPILNYGDVTLDMSAHITSIDQAKWYRKTSRI